MADRRFKLKLNIPSFQLCRSKQSISTFPANPIIKSVRRSNPKTFDITYPNLPAPPPSSPEHEHNPVKCRHHISSSKEISIGCSCRSKTCTKYVSASSSNISTRNESLDNYTWRRKIHCIESILGDELPFQLDVGHSMYMEKKTANATVHGNTTNTRKYSQKDEEGEGVDDDGSEALISTSKSYSFGSSLEVLISSEESTQTVSEEWNELKTRKYSKKMTSDKEVKEVESQVLANKRGIETRMKVGLVEQREGKLRESFATVKKSDNPCEDFKSSMLEMIMEKELFETEELEDLLHCFLSLNSRQHHPIIVQAFTFIWELLFNETYSSKQKLCR